MLGFASRCLVGPESKWTSSPKLVPTPLILFGTNSPCILTKGGLVPNKISGLGTSFGLLVHALPGPNKRFALKRSTFFLAELGKNTTSPAASFVLPTPLTKSYFCDSRCPFGQIDNRKHVLGRFRSHFQKKCWRVDLKRASRLFDCCKLDLMGHRWLITIAIWKL
jgi:hypothetical protein